MKKQFRILFITKCIDMYRNNIFSWCYFFSYFCWSVNCMIQFSKFHNFFLTSSKTETSIVWVLLVLSFMEISIPPFQYFFSFFHLVCKFFNSFFSHFLLVSKLYGWVFELCNIFPEIFRSLSKNLYFRPFKIVICGKCGSYCLYLRRIFSSF